MPRAVSTLTGLIVAGAIAYKYRDNVATETADIRGRLQNVKSTLDDMAAGTVHKAIDNPNISLAGSYIDPYPKVAEAHSYVTQRFVPSVKGTWNDHVSAAASNLINSDLPGKARKVFVEKVLGESDK
ncbi:hypothetical protein INT44_001520 [Umbelopsis vinacea]|uniref:Uncharacterized protein n=1 Tax=Umbelopsis vinacea TaxID=44442 RepID=A0A8H7PQK9_9FUNG|nr:hypothetical protein INT44_001520 [Umbelopsis vinacea]KAI9283470.1 hypothetical protein BC943DRAFT_327701 [Umbelopsis sp. AD052]